MRHAPLPVAFLVLSSMLALTACPGDADETSAASGAAAGGRAAAAGAAGAARGDGGSGADGAGPFESGDTSGGAGGNRGAGEGPPAGGAGGAGLSNATAGAAGATQPTGPGAGSGGEGPALQAPNPCVGKYLAGAHWPAAGRCSARGSSAPFAGPAAFTALRSVAIGAPIFSSPVIDEKGRVTIASAVGLRRFDKDLSSPPEILAGNAVSTSPILLETGEVVILTQAGELLAFGEGGALREIAFVRKGDDDLKGAKETRTWDSSPALNNDGEIVFASPRGRIYIVDANPVKVTTPPTAASTRAISLGTGVSVTTSSVAISASGDIFVGTSKGLAVARADAALAVLVASAPVSTTPVFLGQKSSAVFADDAGVLHAVSIKESSPKDFPATTALTPFPGSISVLTTSNEPRLFVGDGSTLRPIAATDGPASIELLGSPFVASGPISAAAASDLDGRLFVPSTDGNLYIVKQTPTDDNKFASLDSFLTDGALTAPAALAPHRVYFGSGDGSLYLLADEKLK